ncbi:unnamed protein product [Camellia sinensis]
MEGQKSNNSEIGEVKLILAEQRDGSQMMKQGVYHSPFMPSLSTIYTTKLLCFHLL